jgi:hypothetical protein
LLFISYGLPKSASTFCWQLTADIAEAAGNDQTALGDTFLPPDTIGDAYLALEEVSIPAIAAALPKGNLLVVKTHSRLDVEIGLLIDEGLVQASCTFRDPRDAALAVHDRAPLDRAGHARRDFGDVFSVTEAIDLIADNIPVAYSWLASDDRVLKMPFDLLALDAVAAARRLASWLGVEVDVAALVEPYRIGQKEIFEFNQGLRGRHRECMTSAELDYADRRFGSSIEYFERLSQEILRSEGIEL